MSKQSYTGIFSIIIILVSSEWRPTFRHQGYFVGWKALLQTTIIFWLLAIFCSLILLLIFTVSLFQTLPKLSLIIWGPKNLFPCLTSEIQNFLLQAEFFLIITSGIWKRGSSKKQVQNFITHKALQTGYTTYGCPHKSSSTAFNNLGSALLSIYSADGNSLCRVRGMGHFLAECPYVQA